MESLCNLFFSFLSICSFSSIPFSCFILLFFFLFSSSLPYILPSFLFPLSFPFLHYHPFPYLYFSCSFILFFCTFFLLFFLSISSSSITNFSSLFPLECSCTSQCVMSNRVAGFRNLFHYIRRHGRRMLFVYLNRVGLACIVFRYCI